MYYILYPSHQRQLYTTDDLERLRPSFIAAASDPYDLGTLLDSKRLSGHCCLKDNKIKILTRIILLLSSCSYAYRNNGYNFRQVDKKKINVFSNYFSKVSEKLNIIYK